MKVKKYEDLLKIIKELEVLQKESKSFICVFCGKPKKDTKIFGDKRICKSCVARMEKLFPKERVKDTAEILLYSPIKQEEKHTRTYYSSKGNIIVLLNSSATVRDTIKAISHEFLHYILHKTMGIAVCAQYDNIAYKYYKQEDIAYGVVDLEENEEKEIIKLELGIDKVRIRS